MSWHSEQMLIVTVSRLQQGKDDTRAVWEDLLEKVPLVTQGVLFNRRKNGKWTQQALGFFQERCSVTPSLILPV